MTDREKVMQDMERVAFPIYKPNSKDIMVLGSLYNAGYRKEEEVQKKTARKILQILLQYGDRDEALRRHILDIADDFGAEVEE